MSKFGWSYPPGAANDPFAPYNQDFDDSDKPGVHWSIRRLVRNLVGNDGLGRFYKAVYKGSACGVSVGFDIDGETYYNDDLYKFRHCDRNFWHNHTINGICITGYVEGSEVELQPVWIEDRFDPNFFWQIVEDIDKEAEFYWIRDNSQWFTVHYTPIDKPAAVYRGRHTWGETKIDGEPPKYVVRKVTEFFESDQADDFDHDSDDIPLGLCVRISGFVNDDTYGL